MVRLSLTFLSVATLFVVVSAAPYCDQQRFAPKFEPLLETDLSEYELQETLSSNQCIPGISVRERQPFQLLSYDLRTFLSKHIKSNLLVSDLRLENKYFQKLEFCIVSTEAECTTDIPTSCVHEDVEYRFRVFEPTKGYLKVDDEQLRIIPDFEEASRLSLNVDEDYGVRIVHLNPDGSQSALETTTPGRAIVLAEPDLYNSKQLFELIS
ncbi:hypothetical protein BGZ93_001424 [Podila epicladia]|nr:hypothetical protein BGZ92_000463 [Podila epicladia]KAG0084026.1 hypothetical protein BGZ93_001424 [Podila epicladia]